MPGRCDIRDAFIELEEYREVVTDSGMGSGPAKSRRKKNGDLHYDYTREGRKNPPARRKTLKKRGLKKGPSLDDEFEW